MRWLAIAMLIGCGARSDLEAPSEASDEPRPLPPAPPSCDDVAYSACRAWTEPVLVSRRRDDALGDADVDWFDGIHVVTYQLRNEAVRVATVDADGHVLWNERAGEGDDPRIAYHAGRASGVVTTGSGIRWLGRDGVPTGGFSATTPSDTSSDVVAHDVFPTAAGFGLLVAPTSDPSSVSRGVYGDVPPTQGDISWHVYWDDTAGPAIHHATGADGLVHRFAIEAGSFDLAIHLFDWQDAPLGPVVSYLLGSGTTFNDALVTDGPVSYLLRAGTGVTSVLELSTTGGEQTHAFSFDDFGPVSPHAERLGTRNGLRDIVFVDARITPGTLSVARFDPVASTLDDPIALGPPGRDPRMARTSRGLSVAWVSDDGDVWLNALDCCIAP